LDARLANPSLDTVPREVWHRVRDRIATTGMAHRALSAGLAGKASVSTVAKSSASRPRLGQIAAVLGDEELEMLATNDVFWDEIVEITSVGEQEVFDATVMKTHNFIADGVAVHNSIEQDADAVILLHREDYYEKESPRAGEADFIVAKHRNGPTDTITVAFQGHFSRFVDMSTGM
jgi:replicative DNA helicase